MDSSSEEDSEDSLRPPTASDLSDSGSKGPQVDGATLAVLPIAVADVEESDARQPIAAACASDAPAVAIEAPPAAGEAAASEAPGAAAASGGEDGVVVTTAAAAAAAAARTSLAMTAPRRTLSRRMTLELLAAAGVAARARTARAAAEEERDAAQRRELAQVRCSAEVFGDMLRAKAAHADAIAALRAQHSAAEALAASALARCRAQLAASAAEGARLRARVATLKATWLATHRLSGALADAAAQSPPPKRAPAPAALTPLNAEREEAWSAVDAKLAALLGAALALEQRAAYNTALL